METIITVHFHPHQGGVDGPTSSKSYIYDVAASPAGGYSRGLQPFDISTTSFKSPVAGSMAASSFGFFPFTNAQWKELETQAMIYKYMRASLPVPPELLLPITRNLSGHAASHSTFGRGSVYNLRFSNKLDPEPGRCKRTDGKKWRCAKDVAPDQKYCERHVNRGRARSRKHVETHSDFKNNKKPRLQNVLATTPNTVMGNLDDSATRYLGSAAQQYHLNSGALFPGQRSESKGPIFESMVSVPTPHKEPRSLEWMMEQKGVPFTTSNQKWHQLMEIKTELQPVDCRSICSTDACVYQHHYDKHEPLDLNSYVHFGAGKDQFLNLNPNDVPQTENPRGFIDAWSNIAEDSVSSKGNLSMSALNLSIASDNTIGDKIGQIEMGLGIINSDENNKSQISNWSNPSSSWIGTITLGGPLAEVLRSNTSVSSVAGSPITGNGDQASPREAATVSSSPSGVLQKTFASVSDSSGNSSPTFVASRLESKIGFQWMKQSNY